MNQTEEIATLDQWFPPCGPCAFCGFPDKRHRLWDMWIGMHYQGGDSAESIQCNWDYYPIEAVRAVLEIRPYQKEEP